MTTITIDSSEPPIIVVGSGQVVALADLDKYADRLGAYLKGTSPIVLVIDSRAVAPMRFTAEHRRSLAAQRKLLEERYPGRVSARAFVVASQLARGVLTAIFWLSPPSCPTEVFGELEEARRWARAQAARVAPAAQR